jgi:hypothetical protein
MGKAAYTRWLRKPDAIILQLCDFTVAVVEMHGTVKTREINDAREEP